MTRNKVIARAAATVIAVGAVLGTTVVGTAGADYPKCAHTKAVSKVCPNGGINGTPQGGDTRPPAPVPGSNGWGYSYNADTNDMEWGKKSD